ncbi:MAG: BON domain-containing protein [Endomicrobiales bacterium]
MRSCVMRPDEKYVFPKMITALGLGISLFLFPAAAQAQQNGMSDRDITFAAENILSADPRVTFELIDVRSASGNVTLSGSVRSLPAKAQALAAAGTIRGVRAVAESLVVRVTERPDTELREDVKATLANDPAARRCDIKVNAKGGIVVLAGKAPSWQAKELVTSLSRSVRGVRDVINDCYVEKAAPRQDREIEEDIRYRFENDVWLTAVPVTPTVSRGKAVLKGTARSVFEKERARSLAHVGGVDEVDDAPVKVEPPLPGEARRPERSRPRSDNDIGRAVQNSFRYDPRLSPFNPEVEVDSGIVALRGIVGDRRARQSAEEDAKNISGVARVVNRLRVRPAVIPDDEALAAGIRYALEADPYLFRYEFTVTAANGTVYLRGIVDNLFDRSRAEDAAAVEGVVNVENALTLVKTLVAKSDEELAQDVQSLIDASVFFIGDDIAVTAKDGIVTLKGTVRSLRAQERAQDLGYEGGASSVLTYLKPRNAALP